jgi:hypothetical protein
LLLKLWARIKGNGFDLNKTGLELNVWAGIKYTGCKLLKRLELHEWAGMKALDVNKCTGIK